MSSAVARRLAKPSIFLSTCLLIACFLAVTSSVRAQPVNAAGDWLKAMAFLPGRQSYVQSGNPAQARSVSLCIDPRLRGRFSLASVTRATGWNPFSFQQDGRSCRVQMSLETRPVGNWVKTWKHPACAISLGKPGFTGPEIWATTAPTDKSGYLKCIYRVALFYQGLEGALAAKEARLFQPTRKTLLAGEETLVGKVVPQWMPRLKFCRFRMPKGGDMSSLDPANVCQRSGKEPALGR